MKIVPYLFAGLLAVIPCSVEAADAVEVTFAVHPQHGDGIPDLTFALNPAFSLLSTIESGNLVWNDEPGTSANPVMFSSISGAGFSGAFSVDSVINQKISNESGILYFSMVLTPGDFAYNGNAVESFILNFESTISALPYPEDPATPTSYFSSLIGQYSPQYSDISIVWESDTFVSTLDDMTIASVPEPNSIAILALGGALLCLGRPWFRRKVH